MKHHEIIVIGAGHAGVEAAWSAARMGRDVAICTLTMDTIAHMPCNPAIGGTAKGHLVREIDALGGLMGIAIDATAIQFKLLNRSRGHAVGSPRAQADKRRYGDWVRRALEREPNISWIVGRAGKILVDNGRVAGLALEDGDVYRCDALVVTTGTFLNGLVHVGREQRPSGRAGEPPSRRSRGVPEVVGFSWGRLKTGTPRACIGAASTSRASPRKKGTIHRWRSRSSVVRFSAIRSPVTCGTPPPVSTPWCASRSHSLRSTTGKSPVSALDTARHSKTR
jgi:tRNA uridine 5-carboxymethylaminomethyl modification enzyme